MFKEDSGEGISTVFQDLDLNDELFIIEEVEKATSTFREGKASRPDGIPPEASSMIVRNRISSLSLTLFQYTRKAFEISLTTTGV